MPLNLICMAVCLSPGEGMLTWLSPYRAALLATGTVATEHPPPMIIIFVGGELKCSNKLWTAFPASHFRII